MGKQKITKRDVRAIRKLYREGVKQEDIARKMNLSQSYVSLIVRRKVWK